MSWHRLFRFLRMFLITGLVLGLLMLEATAEEKIGVAEKRGDRLPLDAVFTDSNGNRLVLGDYIDKPTFLLLVFFHCAQACGLQTAYLANAVGRMSEVPGNDFQVLSISFDEQDTPEDAKHMKSNYLTLTEKQYPAPYWKFLTGDSDNIRRVTEATGFQFIKVKEHDFLHPNVLVMIGKDGKIMRYLYGPEFKPFDLSMAIAEAEQGILGISVKKALSYCFAYDPLKKRYVFQIFRVIAVLTFLTLMAFYFFFLRKGKRK